MENLECYVELGIMLSRSVPSRCLLGESTELLNITAFGCGADAH
ncbi:MAG: hypothetical protein ACI9OU_001716, partial [Candidatus Promineifilaceae bacterium]